MSLQIILRMRSEMSGEESDRAAASVLASFELEGERPLIDITRAHGISWLAIKSEMHLAGRYHIEVY